MRTEARRLLLSFWLIVAAAIGIPGRPASAAESVCPPAGGESFTVVRLAADGLPVLDDGSQVRVAGVILPQPPEETSSSDGWPPFAEMRSFLEQVLIGKIVRLAPDGRDRDRYDVRVAHVVFESGAEIAWLAAELVKRGLARVDPLRGLGPCVERLLVLEAEARAAGAGLWRLPHYRLRDAANTAAMRADALQFVIAEGVVHDVVRRGADIYLNFGPERRTGFSASISERDRKGIEASGLRLADLAGLRVRLRGYVELRDGPIIRIGHHAQIEPLEVRDASEAQVPAKRKRPAR